MADIITDIDAKTKDRKSFLELQARVLLLEDTVERLEKKVQIIEEYLLLS